MSATGWSVGFGPTVDYTYSGVVDPPPPPPPPTGVQRFGTPLFGQSFSRYKKTTISGLSGRYAAVEGDTGYTLSGTPRKGGAVVRVYNTAGTGAGTWANACPSYVRAGQTVIYSFKQAASVSRSAFKADVRSFLASKDPAATPFCWLVYNHEWDNDGTPGDAAWVQWFDRNAAIREVLDESAFAGRADLSFGFISTGVPWAKGTAATSTKGWRTILNTMAAQRGGDDTWEFVGGDIYNSAWDGPNVFVPVDNWLQRPDECFTYSGLPMVIGECGTPRPYSNYTSGTYAQLDQQRVDWLRQLFTAVVGRGYFDALSWWREPALKGTSNPFSTIMATPTGYDAALAAAARPPGGFDAQGVVDLHSEFMVKSIDTANTLGVGPHALTYYA